MQFAVWASRGDKHDDFDCAACKGKNFYCLLYNKNLKVKAPNMPEVEINKQNVFDLVSLVNNTDAGVSHLNELEALLEFGVCPIPLQNTTTSGFITAHRILQGFGHNSINDLESYPARLYDAVSIIEAESGRMNKIMDKVTKGRRP